MPSIVTQLISDHVRIISALEHLETEIHNFGKILVDGLRNGKRVLLCGNGGSAADAQHIAAELVCRFESHRRPLPAIALTTDTSALTAIGNDLGFEQLFARQVAALGSPEDILIAISTSGNSPNVVEAVLTARRNGLITIGLLGQDGGRLKDLVDHGLVIPSPVTARIQECHILIGHIWCAMADAAFSE